MQEPVVLPARVPNLLVNGTNGIAVGMATNIPPHNLGEVIEATVHLVRRPARASTTSSASSPGPTSPPGASSSARGIEHAYRTGRGTIVMRARVDVEKSPGRGEKEQIVVTEIPYQVNKARVAARISELVREKKLEGIAEVRDESDATGFASSSSSNGRHPAGRRHPALSADGPPDELRRHQPGDRGGAPAVLNLKETLQAFIAHRRDVVTRRTRYELETARDRAHILEGLIKVLDNLDETIADHPCRPG